MPDVWPTSHDVELVNEPFRLIELPVCRPGDVNRHSYRDAGDLDRVIAEICPDVVDIQEEPFSAAASQWVSRGALTPTVMYTAQNIDKRLPPPFNVYERRSLRSVQALYPCSSQAASVARGKGFAGLIDVIPLGYDDKLFVTGDQAWDAPELVLCIAGRLVLEKGVLDAIHVLAAVRSRRPARLVVVGRGVLDKTARRLVETLGLAEHVTFLDWQPSSHLAEIYRTAHVVLVPSRATTTWAEQFGRVILEAQASGAIVAGYASGAIPETGGRGALLVAEGESAELARAICALSGDADEWERHRQEGSRLSSARTWTRVAERQADLFARAQRLGSRRPFEPSPRRRRLRAIGEFGDTAVTPAGRRPFALPILRRGGAFATALARLIDVFAEARAVGMLLVLRRRRG